MPLWWSFYVPVCVVVCCALGVCASASVSIGVIVCSDVWGICLFVCLGGSVSRCLYACAFIGVVC